MAEAEHARREAFQEAERRANVEKNAIEAKRRVSLKFSSTTLTFSFVLELMIKNI